jgi:hypothetical protein
MPPASDKRAQDWRWSSLRSHKNGPPIADCRMARPSNWTARVNAAMEKQELSMARTSITRGRPLRSERWMQSTAARLKLGSTLAEIGRPRRPIESLSARQRRRREKQVG